MTSRVDYHYEVPKKVLSIGHVGSFFSIFHLTPVTYLALLEGGTMCVIYCIEPPVGLEPSLYRIKFFLLSNLRTDLHKLLPVIAHPKFAINSNSPDSSRLLVLVSIQGIIDLLLQYVTVSIIPTLIGTPNGSLSKHEIF